MFKQLIIEGLYDLYSYDIKFDNEPNVQIVTGPNGFGKTTILQIINHFCSRQFWYFYFLPFSTIKILFDSNVICCMNRKVNRMSINGGLIDATVCIEMNKDGNKIEVADLDIVYISNLLKYYGIQPNGDYDYSRIDEKLDWEYLYQNDTFVMNNFPKILDFLKGRECIMIKEQRLVNYLRRTVDKLPVKTVDDIQEYIERLFLTAQKAYNLMSLKVDGSFVKRLSNLAENKTIKHIKRDTIHKQVLDKIAKFKKYGLVGELEIVEKLGIHYEEVLKLYLNDLDTKLKTLSPFYDRLSTFEQLVSSKGLAYKHLVFKDGKMYVISESGHEIPPHNLSSGEQNLLVLCYKLVFELSNSKILLIDEPENSLHMAWLDNLLADYLKIAKVTGCQMIIATHSPTFIHGFWNLTYDLCENGKIQKFKGN